MTVVLDASAAVELILKREFSGSIRTRLAEADKIISSDLYKAEITNVFWKYIKADMISRQEGVKYIGFSRDLVDEYYDIAPFSIECLNEAVRLNHSTYDMLYLILAKRTGGVLFTMDKKLMRLAGAEGLDTAPGMDASQIRQSGLN